MGNALDSCEINETSKCFQTILHGLVFKKEEQCVREGRRENNDGIYAVGIKQRY